MTMEFTAPLSTIMTRKLVTVKPGDKLSVIKGIFDSTRIHHLPVVKNKTLVGIISRADMAQFINGAEHVQDKSNRNHLLEQNTVEALMTTGIATLESTDRINVAIEIFAENLFHAIPIVDDGELTGIVTTLDVIKALQAEDMKRILSN